MQGRATAQEIAAIGSLTAESTELRRTFPVFAVLRLSARSAVHLIPRSKTYRHKFLAEAQSAQSNRKGAATSAALRGEPPGICLNVSVFCIIQVPAGFPIGITRRFGGKPNKKKGP